MQKPEYVSNVTACLVNPGIAFAAYTVGVWWYCGYILAVGV